MEVIMRLSPEITRRLGEHLEDLHETNQVIERLEKRIDAQERRIAQLKIDGVDIEPAENLRDGMRNSLQELIKHRALIMLAIVQRES